MVEKYLLSGRCLFAFDVMRRDALKYFIQLSGNLLPVDWFLEYIIKSETHIQRLCTFCITHY